MCSPVRAAHQARHLDAADDRHERFRDVPGTSETPELGNGASRALASVARQAGPIAGDQFSSGVTCAGCRALRYRPRNPGRLSSCRPCLWELAARRTSVKSVPRIRNRRIDSARDTALFASSTASWIPRSGRGSSARSLGVASAGRRCCRILDSSAPGSSVTRQVMQGASRRLSCAGSPAGARGCPREVRVRRSCRRR